jgi:hypothetical protein
MIGAVLMGETDEVTPLKPKTHTELGLQSHAGGLNQF